MLNNVLLVTFKNQISAYEVLSEIKKNYVGKNYVISEAAVIKKENGHINFKEGVEISSKGTFGFLSGGLIGSFIGIIGGPLGVIFGGSLGSLLGLSDAEKVDIAAKGILTDTGKYLTEDNFGLVLLSTEENEAELDEFLNKFDADIILRKDATVVLKELEIAKEYERELKKDATKAKLKNIFNTKKDEFKANIEEFNKKLKKETDNFSNKLLVKIEKLKNSFK